MYRDTSSVDCAPMASKGSNQLSCVFGDRLQVNHQYTIPCHSYSIVQVPWQSI